MGEQEQVVGFGASPDGLVRVFDRAGGGLRVAPCSEEALDALEREALHKDRSPALYHWDDLLFVSGETCERVYCRGKDFIPFTGLEYVEQVRARLANPSLGPTTLQVQPYQVCNDDCTFCCTAEYRERPIYKGKKFSKEEWFALLERHAEGGGKVVEIIGGGEPTLHPAFIDVLEHLHRLGLKAYLFTNGSRFTFPDGSLNRRLLDAIAQACVLLNVSLDGYREREKVHRRLRFERTRGTLEGMRYIHARRDPAQMAFYSSYILTGGTKQASNALDFYECVEQQAGWVDSMHIQNDFVSLSHLEFEVEQVRHELQRTIDAFFGNIYLYFNYPLISRFGLEVPFHTGWHNVPSHRFETCSRGWLAPTVECGSNKAWPCGKYAGEAQPEDQRTFASIPDQLAALRGSPDRKGGMQCDPCIHSSYNHALLEIEKRLRQAPSGRFFHFYPRALLARTLRWKALRAEAKAAAVSNLAAG